MTEYPVSAEPELMKAKLQDSEKLLDLGFAFAILL
jgi:hypothetical protein